MPNYTIVGDLHVTHKSLDLTDRLFDKIEKLGNDVILLGDLLDTKEVIRGKCLNLLFKRLHSSNLNYLILIGNHDLFNLESIEHSLEVLKTLPNVRIIDYPQEIDDMYFIPFNKNMEYLRTEIKKAGDKIIIGHFDINGFDYGNGHICDKGLARTDFKESKLVISGHFHKYSKTGNITYLGTPFSHTFGESNQIKYIATFDKVKLKLIKTNFPQHKTVEIQCDHPLDKASFKNIKNNDIVRVILSGSQENIDSYLKEPNDYKYIERPTVINDTTIKIDETLDNVVQFTNWGTDIGKLDEETLNIGLEILKMVNE